MPKKFEKSNISAHAKTWEDYQEYTIARENYPLPIFFPIYVGMNDKGEIIRNRIKVDDLGDPSDTSSIIGSSIDNSPVFMHDYLTKIYKDYEDYFGGNDKSQSAFPTSILDFDFKVPVVFMFFIKNDNWTFTGSKQFSTDNDSIGNPTVKQICSFGSMRGILVENNCKAKERIKYNLHVTVSQYEKNRVTEVKELMTTDIIIDPGMNPDDETGN